MVNPDPQRAESLFNQALERDSKERAAFVERECGDDAALRKRVEALLAAHDEASGFLPGDSLDSFPATFMEPGSHQLDQSPLIEEPGTVIDRYKLLEQLGEGGFGVVWAAEQKEPVRRRVALKIIKLGMDTQQVVARFEAERQALALMDHPNIAKVLDAGSTQSGRPYFVMELVRGIAITKYCDQENLDTAARLDLFLKVCHAIQHAHQKGIIHRDIKPSNVMVTLHDGVPVPKVIDFGIAKATQAELTEKTIYTQYSQFIGTPAYMSPEQAEMSGLDIDTRSDIYSLGVLLYELLTGSTPFDTKELMQSGLDEMRKIIREREPMRPSTRVSQTLSKSPALSTAKNRPSILASDLDWIVMKCLEKDRTRRYDSATDLAADLKRHLSNEPILARPPSAAYRFQKAWRRNKLTYSAAIAVAMSLVLGISLSIWQAEVARDAEQTADRARLAEKEQKLAAQVEAERANAAEESQKQLRVQAEEQELAARRRAYAADMRLCQRALALNNLREAQQLLDRQRPKEGQLDLRGWEWRHLWQQCQPTALHELGTHEQRVLSALHVDGGRDVVTYEDGGKINRWNAETGKQEAVLQERDVADRSSLMSNSGYMALSQDGAWLAAVSRKTDGSFIVRIWDLEEGSVMVELPTGRYPARAVAFSPDRKSMVTFFADRNVARIWDLEKKEVAREITMPGLKGRPVYGAVCYSRNGQWLAIGGGTGEVQLMEVGTGELRVLSVAGHGGIRTLAFSPAGSQLVVGRGFIDPNVRVMDVRSGNELRTLSGHRGFIADVAFSSDGSLLASASGDQTIKLWDTATWTERNTLRGHTDEVWSVDFSPDGRTLVSGGKDRHAFVWPVGGANQRDDSTLLPEPAPSDADVSPDGKRVVTIARGLVHIWGERNSVHEKLGTNNVSAFWATPGEILLGANDPPRIQVWNLVDQTVAVFPLKSQKGKPAFAYLPASHILVAFAREEGGGQSTITRWDVNTRRDLSVCSIAVPQLPQDALRAILSQDGLSLAVPRQGGRVEIHDLVTGIVRSTLAMPTDRLQGMALAPDGEWFACANQNVPLVEIWDVSEERKRLTLPGHNLVLLKLEFSRDGKRLMTSTIGSEPLRLWDTVGWQTVFSFEPTPETYLWKPCHLSDGNTIAFNEGIFSTGKHRIRLWQAPSWEEIQAVEAEAAR